MYHAIVKRNLLRSFEAINRQDYEFITKQFSQDAHHYFSGENHPLAGLRTNKEDIISWYARLERLMPDLHFQIEEVSISGFPNRTIAFLKWSDTLTDRDGKQYSNRGVHVITISWGKVISLEVYCDTKYLQGYFDALVAHGVSEAQEQPIIS